MSQPDPVILGKQAQDLSENETLVQAYAWLEKDAMRAFHSAETPDECWRAKQKLEVVGEFVAILRTWIRHGEEAAKALAAEQESMRAQRAVENESANYIARATEARQAYDASQGRVTQGDSNGGA